ncbi:fumarylacetoacetate hydrolase family protein [Endozoicomonas lisbonensis]|uniref:5-oxopent-3-ene-1,2,5-tricarboxylate decarboxylase/2-hydroxyhepta-2,4-diene-1,7-dioate isomerase n=1 Tax=Endozoicomonas lisbonensis TaxID=3120522 RepID=A0ABV2SIH2_9GAMM
MKHARVEINAVVEQVTCDDANPDSYQVMTRDGRTYSETEVTWLPPKSGVIIGLALNYADHAAELDFDKPESPILFVKSPSSSNAHNKKAYRPDNVNYMHYESELVVVIGKTASKVKAEEAMDYVGGYTVCNELTVRDYLEDFSRPPIKVKNVDSFGPLGPWVVDRDDIDDPHNLAVRTWVNGELRQEGNTRDLIFNIPELIEYISSFMTLQPGDMIATGTPKGLSDVKPGDEIIVEVESVGRLRTWLVSEEEYYSQAS